MQFSFQRRTKKESELTKPIKLSSKQKHYVQSEAKSDFYRRLDTLCTKIYEFNQRKIPDHPIVAKQPISFVISEEQDSSNSVSFLSASRTGDLSHT